MKITKVECIPVSIPLAKPMVMSSGPVTRADGVVLKIHTDEGVTGIAETGDTSLWYMGETQDSIMYNLMNVFAPQMLIGEDPFNIETIVAKMDEATRANNHSKAVVDFALHDLMGKALGVPVYKLLGGLSNPKIPLAFVMSSGTPEEVAAEAKALVEAGFQGLKLKVGAQGSRRRHRDDRRREGGRGQQGQTDDRRQRRLDVPPGAVRPAEGGQVRCLPLRAAGALVGHRGLARLRRKVDVPIFADESAAELGHVLQIIKKDAADGFFLKVPKAGGILKSRRWVCVAQAANMPVMCGCMINSGLGSAAEAAFLGATAWMGRIEQESIGPLNLYNIFDTVSGPIENDLAKKAPRYEKGYLYPPEGVGLGVELDEASVERLATPGKPPVIIGE